MIRVDSRRWTGRYPRPPRFLLRFKDRIGEHTVLRFGRWFVFGVVGNGRYWAGSCYLMRRRLWLRPILYDKVAP